MGCRTVASFSTVVALLVACAAPDPAAGTDWSRAAWLPCTSFGKASLRGLAVVDATTLWVSGAAGTLRRTTDGGATWQDVAPPGTAACDFRDVEAFDAHSAVAMVAGQPARVFRTVDGGRTWTVVLDDPRPAAFFDSLAFAGDRGVLVGDPVDGSFCAWTTADAGRTWDPVPAERLVAAPDEAAFAASGGAVAMVERPGGPRPALVTGGSASRFRLDANGRSWTAVDLPLQKGASSRGAFAVAFLADPMAAAHGVVVGGDHAAPDTTGGTAAFTTDGGRTWHAAAPPPDGYHSGVVWFDHRTVLACGPNGCSVSADRGRSWREFGATGFHAIARGRDGSVFACGSDGRVARLAPPR